MNNILQVNGLSKAFKGFRLENISFALEKGCIMGFVGENGAGKTTTIKMILNAIEKSTGEIKVFGKDHIAYEEEIKEKIGYVPADDYFTANSTLNRHAKALKLFYKKWDDKLFNALCTNWKLPLNQKIFEYSKGMKTKAMLALALAHKPELLILDEPTAGLDPVARIEVLDILRDFVANGERAVCFSTHITTDLDKVADYITLIHGGKIRESLPIDQIEEKYALVEGDLEDLAGKADGFIGIRKGQVRFEGLILREKAMALFDISKIKTPNIENLLVYTIWGDKDEKSLDIIKSL